MNVAPIVARNATFYRPETEFPVQVDRRLQDCVGLEIHTCGTYLACTVEQGPSEPPPDSPTTNALVDGHLGELVGTTPHGYEGDRSDGLTLVQRHEDRATGLEDFSPRVLEIRAVGVLDLPVKSDPVQVHLAERFGVLRPEVDDLDLSVLARLVVPFHVTDIQVIPSVAP